MRPDEREALFEQARELSTQQRQWADADTLWGEVIKAYRAAVTFAARPDRNDQRQLARAMWRRSMLLSAMGRPIEGVDWGRQAVELFEQINIAVTAEEPDVAAPRRDEALAELITSMLDLAEIIFVAGDADARIQLIDRALGEGLSVVQPPDAGRRTQEAMGTGYHNYANALLHRYRQREEALDAREAALAGSRAVQLRQELVDLSRPLSMWELANTYAVYAQCLALIGDTRRAAAVIELGDGALDILGPAGADIAAKLMIAKQELNAAGKPGRRGAWWRKP
jgi:hypothetical protein